MPRRFAGSLALRLAPICVLGTLLFASACHGGGEESEPLLARLERLAFLPAGNCLLPLAQGSGLDCSTTTPLLVDRFEVTRDEWDAFRRDQRVDPLPGRLDPRATPRWPAVWMDLAEARRFADAQGMRIPTAREWLRVAAGTRAQRWPWSSQDAESVTNTLDLGLHRPTDAGSFPLGATSSGVHDLLGNVREWTEGELGALQEGASGNWVMGGSFLEYKRPIYQSGRVQGPVVCGELVEAERRSMDTGVRLVADASPFLQRRLAGWRPNPSQRARLVAVGRSWGPASRSLLSELAERPDASPALDALLEGARQ
ncbi:MAG: SUMF1/EgtB/PvdO family nonheme iron enzyme [Planctomycetes bacterium]|nr:SUMF1/EgtB/PvdO family nonheme iron enzyme [Planctomycetota bacterium]MCB9905392.1 SUMF1/EgtB/PvdO family nonheme iron enzyme [Planctomycetota bacterium]